MIGYLRGRLIARQPPHLLIDVNGVGYEVEAPMSVFYGLPSLEEEVRVYTHLAIRDDAHTLYGFGSLNERSLFRELIKVNGVGAKMALTILSGMSAEDFARCVQFEDTASLVKLPGIGKKTAQRLVMEMRDRMPEFAAGQGALPVGGANAAPQPAVASGNEHEAVSALMALGYKAAEAAAMVKGILAEDKDCPVKEVIRQALKAAVR